MAPSVEGSALEAWMKRANAMDALVTQAQRRDLASRVAVAKRYLVALATKPREPTLEQFEHVGRALIEVKRAVADRSYIVDGKIFAQLEQLSDALTQSLGPIHLTKRASLMMDDSGSEAASAFAEGVDLLSGLVNADSDALEALVASVHAIERNASSDGIGTLREPLFKKDGAARVLMKGELQAGLLTDLIQLFSQNAETGCLQIEGTGGRHAAVYFKDGRITDATCDSLCGERAFFAAMAIREGRFAYQRGIESQEIRIERSAQHLIMETLRLIDEGDTLLEAGAE